MASLAGVVAASTPLFSWAPKGYREMMKKPRFASLSMAGVKSGSGVVMTPGKWKVLYETTERVNRSAAYMRDQVGADTWGVWSLVNGVRSGDCDDYAVAKLKALLALGWPRYALRLAVCRVGPLQTYHCVLLVYKSNGDAVVLDNRTETLWNKSARKGYTWISEEWPGRTFWWRKIK